MLRQALGPQRAFRIAEHGGFERIERPRGFSLGAALGVRDGAHGRAHTGIDLRDVWAPAAT